MFQQINIQINILPAPHRTVISYLSTLEDQRITTIKLSAAYWGKGATILLSKYLRLKKAYLLVESGVMNKEKKQTTHWLLMRSSVYSVTARCTESSTGDFVFLLPTCRTAIQVTYHQHFYEIAAKLFLNIVLIFFLNERNIFFCKHFYFYFYLVMSLLQLSLWKYFLTILATNDADALYNNLQHVFIINASFFSIKSLQQYKSQSTVA